MVVTDQLQKEGDLTSNTGYHLGVYSEVYFLMFYLRPEFQYTKLSSQFEDDLIDNERIELPLSLGYSCLLYTSPSPRDRSLSRMPSSA